MARMRLNLRKLAEKRGLSLRAISRRGDASWPTVHKYIARPEKVQHLALDSFGSEKRGTRRAAGTGAERRGQHDAYGLQIDK